MKRNFKLPRLPWLNLQAFYLTCTGAYNNNGKLNSDSKLESISLNDFFRKYNTEISAFFLVLIVVFSQGPFNPLSAGSSGNVEQWVNLTNQMFYGKQDFLFSYGPLFWLVGVSTSPYNAHAYWLSIAFTSALSAFFWSIIFTLSYKARAYVYFAVAYFLFFSNLILPASLFLWPFAIVAYLEFSEAKPVILRARGLVVLGVLVGLSFYVRFFYGTVALATFGSYFASRFLGDRKISLPLFFVAGTLAGYVVVGLLIFHDQASVVNYFTINSQLSFGNSVDMTLDIDNYTSSFLAAALVAIFLNIFLVLRNRHLFLTTNVLLLIFFKLGFSRTDHYLGYFVIPAAAVALMMLFDKSKLGRLLFVLVIGSLYYLSIVPVFEGAQTKDSLKPHVDFKMDYARRMQSAYMEFKLDETVLNKVGKSTIDIYPYNNEYMFANKFNYWHRPLFQNYMTLTPTLDSINQRFFESTDRPKFVLWTAGNSCANSACNPFEGFDQKLALNEDPLTSSAILLNYHVIETLKGRNGVPIMLLEENHDTTAYSHSLIATQTMKFDEWYKVPQAIHGVTKLIPELNFTVAGRLKNMLFRGGVLKIKYKLISGEIKEYRTNILNSESGIWVSPLLDSFELSGLAVDSIMLETRSSNYFETTFKAKWISVPIPQINFRTPLFDPMLQTLPGYLKKSQAHCDAAIDVVNGVSLLPSKIDAVGVILIQGWLALSAKDGVTAEKTFLTLTNAYGNTIYVLMRAKNRQDLVAAFKQPSLFTAGYEALIDLSTLKGNYTLGLAGTHKSEFFNCSNYAIPLTVAQ